MEWHRSRFSRAASLYCTSLIFMRGPSGWIAFHIVAAGAVMSMECPNIRFSPYLLLTFSSSIGAQISYEVA